MALTHSVLLLLINDLYAVLYASKDDVHVMVNNTDITKFIIIIPNSIKSIVKSLTK